MVEPKQSLVGYRVATPQGEVGSKGVLYDYLLGANGVFVRAETELLRATVLCFQPQDVEKDVRGLAVVSPSIELPHGKVPSHLLEVAELISAELRSTEHFFAVTWKDGSYHLVYPEQFRKAAAVTYTRPRDALLELHSHRHFGAFFSEQDTQDEAGFGLFGVLSLAGDELESRFRVGVYGYFMDVQSEEVFA